MRQHAEHPRTAERGPLGMRRQAWRHESRREGAVREAPRSRARRAAKGKGPLTLKEAQAVVRIQHAATAPRQREKADLLRRIGRERRELDRERRTQLRERRRAYDAAYRLLAKRGIEGAACTGRAADGRSLAAAAPHPRRGGLLVRLSRAGVRRRRGPPPCERASVSPSTTSPRPATRCGTCWASSSARSSRRS